MALIKMKCVRDLNLLLTTSIPPQDRTDLVETRGYRMSYYYWQWQLFNYWDICHSN